MSVGVGEQVADDLGDQVGVDRRAFRRRARRALGRLVGRSASSRRKGAVFDLAQRWRRRPRRSRARVRRSSTRRSTRRISRHRHRLDSAHLRGARGSPGGPALRVWPRIAVSGLRSSWEASETNWRWRAKARSRRSSMWLNASARVRSSAGAAGLGVEPGGEVAGVDLARRWRRSGAGGRRSAPRPGSRRGALRAGWRRRPRGRSSRRRTGRPRSGRSPSPRPARSPLRRATRFSLRLLAPESPPTRATSAPARRRRRRRRRATTIAPIESARRAAQPQLRSRRDLIARSTQPVADRAHGLDRGRRAGPAELAPQVADVDLDDVGAGVVVVAPDRGEDLLAAADPTGVAHQVGEQLGLAIGEPHGGAVPARLAGQQVEPDPGSLKGRVGGVVGLAQASPDAGQQLLEGEWLGQVVGGAEVETLDPVGDLGLRRSAGSPAAPAWSA